MFNVFAVLAVLPPTAQPSGPGLGMEEVPLVLNVLEMLMCLVFRSLPVESLREWLPIDGHGHEYGESGTGIASSNWRRVSREGVMGGLNIACPLDQGVTQLKERPFVDLRDDEDELVKEWLREMDREREGRREAPKAPDKTVEKNGELNREEVESRKKAYVQKARAYNKYIEPEGVFVPNWVLLGAAAMVVGWALFRSNGGPRR